MTAEPLAPEPHIASSWWIRGLNVLSTAAALAAATSVVGTLRVGASTPAAEPAFRAAVAGTFVFGVVATIAVRALSPTASKLVSLGAMVLAVAFTALFSFEAALPNLAMVIVAVGVAAFAWGPGLLLVWYAFGRPLDAARNAARFPRTLTASDAAERRVAKVAAMYGAVDLWLVMLQQLLLRGPVARHAVSFTFALLALTASALAARLLARRSTFRRSFLARVRAGTERDYRLARDARGREVLTRVRALPDGVTGGGYRVAEPAEEEIGILDAREDAAPAPRRGRPS